MFDKDMLYKLNLAKNDLVVVVGAGVSGEAACKLLVALGLQVRLLEKNPANISESINSFAKANAVEIITGEHNKEQFADAKLVVVSPGVPLGVFDKLGVLEAGIPLIGEMELALRFIQTPILAVTGTSGKTTTVSLMCAMLEAAGKRVFLGGNIGTPLSSFVLAQKEVDVLVLEMSSFQLQLCSSLRPKVAVILNISENHLDQHKDMAEYIDAKFKMCALQTADDFAILPEYLIVEAKKRAVKASLCPFERLGIFTETKLLGDHNIQNAEVAFQACKIFGVKQEEAIKAVRNFEPIAHRFENLGEVAGVLYINDSKCTTTVALQAALESCQRPVILLAGGKFKGGDLRGLGELLRKKAKYVVLYGGSREYFENAWQDFLPVCWEKDLTAAMKKVQTLASAGDMVVLSPATASYDQYKNYMERGEHLRQLVQALSKESA